MSNDDPWAPKKTEKTKGKTFWLKLSTLEKLAAIQKCAADSDKIIAIIKKSIEDSIDRLYEIRPKK